MTTTVVALANHDLHRASPQVEYIWKCPRQHSDHTLSHPCAYQANQEYAVNPSESLGWSTPVRCRLLLPSTKNSSFFFQELPLVTILYQNPSTSLTIPSETLRKFMSQPPNRVNSKTFRTQCPPPGLGFRLLPQPVSLARFCICYQLASQISRTRISIPIADSRNNQASVAAGSQTASSTDGHGSDVQLSRYLC